MTFNESSETWPEGDLFTWHAGELILLPTVMVIGIVGNILVLYIYSFRHSGSTVTLIKRMLAGIDLITLVFGVPLLLYTIIYPDMANFKHVCVFMSFFVHSTAVSANCVLLVIAVDRFMRLCLLSRKGVGGQNAKRLFLAIIILSGLINIPSAWVFGKVSRPYTKYKVHVTHCFIKMEYTETTLFRVYVALMLFLFLPSLMAMLFLYVKMIATLRKHSDVQIRLTASSQINSPAAIEKTRAQKSQEKMYTSIAVFVIITVLYFVTNFLYCCVLVTYLLDTNVNEHMTPYQQLAIDLAKHSPLINSMTNPFIYSYTSPTFRQQVYSMLS